MACNVARQASEVSMVLKKHPSTHALLCPCASFLTPASVILNRVLVVHGRTHALCLEVGAQEAEGPRAAWCCAPGLWAPATGVGFPIDPQTGFCNS